MKIFKKLFGEYNFDSLIKDIDSFEPALEKLADFEIKNKSLELKRKISENGLLDSFLPEAFALAREAAKRTLNQRHFKVQLIGGIVLHQGKIAEMSTGEGKTLAATAPVYFNALAGRGAHVITVNDYLARRDAVWMGQIYDFLGLSVSCLTHNGAFLYDNKYRAESDENNKEKTEGGLDEKRDVLGNFKVFQDFLKPILRQEAYKADIIYGTNHEFGFDYLRDNLAYRKEDQVQRERYFAIIDEADSILIDEARTPLIIAAPDAESSDFYKIFAKISNFLVENEDYTVDEKTKSVSINDSGINKTEKTLNVKNLYAPENFQLVHYLEESLKAKALFHLDKQYVVKNGEIIIVDEFTGRLMPGRRYSGGLHQAIEAKEGVKIQQESRTFAQITIQNYFRLYEKISGMTGTAQTSAEELHKVYNLEVVTIPTNKPLARKDSNDLIYKTMEAKYKAVAEEVREKHLSGQPTLLGTASIEKNELVSQLLKQAGIPHEVLNAKNHEREGEIIAQAGKPGAVTVATNMAGRGVDIILGGNPPSIELSQRVREAGGLHIIGTERHEARRIDNQLRGRAGRQGDPGSSQFFLSLEDDLVRVFGGERVKNMMETLNIPEDMPIESKIVSKVVNEAQKKIEGLNFDLRKHLLDYDDVLNKQRKAVYEKRQEILEGNSIEKLSGIALNALGRARERIETDEELKNFFVEIKVMEKEEVAGVNDFDEFIKQKIAALVKPENDFLVRGRLLAIMDRLWMGHLENLEDLRDSVRLRAYGQHDPLVEYRRESHQMFQNLLVNFEDWVFTDIWKFLSEMKAGVGVEQTTQKRSNNNPYVNTKVGRNDPCPCGAEKSDGHPVKYKHCHGKNV